MKNIPLLILTILLLFTACSNNKNIKTESQYIHIDFKNLSVLEFAEKISNRQRNNI